MSSTSVIPPAPKGSMAPSVVAVCIVFGTLCILTISLRWIARFMTLKRLGVDDILITIAGTLLWGFIIATLVGVHYGLGAHIEVVEEQGTIVPYAKMVWVSAIFYNSSLGFIKLSVLTLYARLGDRNLRKMSYVMMVVVSCSTMANFLVCIFECSPIPAAWDTSITHKKCVDIDAFYLANSGTNIATDLLTYFLPLKTVRNLQMPRKQKIAVGVMLCLGLVACVSSIVRVTFIPKMLVSTDTTYVIANPFSMSIVESCIGIVAASIPSMKPLAKKFLPRILGENTSENRRGPTSNEQLSNLKSKDGFSKLSGNHYATYQRDLKHHNLSNSITAVDANDLELYDHAGKPISQSEGTPDDQDRTSNSSEERIIKPNGGGIRKTTNVTTRVDDAERASGSPYYQNKW